MVANSYNCLKMVPWWGQFLKHKKAMKRIILKMFFKYKGGLKAQKIFLMIAPEI